MIDNNTMIKVTNRDNGHVGYTIPDLNNLTRTFTANETKEIPMIELRKLSYIPGGKMILRDYLVLDNKDAIEELLNVVEPEYFYTEEDVKNLLTIGSLDALKDCLDYAPVGTIDLVKKVAVELPLNDVAKRKAILDMTGFNVDSAIMVNEETKEDNNKNETMVRRVNETKNENTKPAGRRTAVNSFVDPNKYKIVK
jgi:hypothetical protein